VAGCDLRVVCFRECVGVLGCEWCQAKSGTEFTQEGQEVHTPLSRPFCSTQATCFGGVLGAPTPYGDRTVGKFTTVVIGKPLRLLKSIIVSL